jgi:hypothetical protein
MNQVVILMPVCARRRWSPTAPGVRGDRQRHSHMFVGVDVAVTDFPDSELGPILREEQLAAIAEVRKTSRRPCSNGRPRQLSRRPAWSTSAPT